MSDFVDNQWGIWKELGLGYQDAAREEIGQGRNRGFDVKKGTVNRGIWESLVDRVVGRTEEGIRQTTVDEHKVDLGDKHGEDLRRLTTLLKDLDAGDLAPTIEGSGNKTSAQLGGEIEDLRIKAGKLETVRGLPGGDKYNMDTSNTALDAAIREGVRTENNIAETNSPQWQRQEDRYIAALDRGNKQFAASMALNSGQLALSNKRADNQMELAQMQQQLQMRRQDSADRRSDRRDRQAMIQQMMAGLSTLGASIAI